MSKYKHLAVRVPVAVNPRQLRADFAAVAAHHGYISDYHLTSEAGSPALFMLAIAAGEVVTCPFDDEWYYVALAGLEQFAGQGWADALAGAIRAAGGRAETAELAEIREDAE